MSWSPNQTLEIGESYLNGRGEVMGPVMKNATSNINDVLLPFKIMDHALGAVTFTKNGKRGKNSQSLDDLILSTEGATRRKLVPGEYYHSLSGEVRGPIIKSKQSALQPINFSFYYVLPDYGRVLLTEDGKAEFAAVSRSLDLTIRGSGPDAPEPMTAEWTPQKASSSSLGKFVSDEIFGKSSHKPKPPKPKEVKLPPPRRRMITINPVRNTVAVEPEGPKWKRLSVFESASVILSLAEVQHIEKQKSLNGDTQGLIVVTGKTNWDHNSGQWMNPVFICENDRVDFLTQFDAYLTFLETPIIVTKEVKPKKKGKDIGKASGVEFLSINAMLPEDGSFFDEDEDDESPF